MNGGITAKETLKSPLGRSFIARKVYLTHSGCHARQQTVWPFLVISFRMLQQKLSLPCKSESIASSYCKRVSSQALTL